MRADPKQALVFFVDLVGSSTVSSERSTKAYWRDYVRPFYVAIERVYNQYCLHEDAPFSFLRKRNVPGDKAFRLSYRGDELVGLVLFPQTEDRFSPTMQAAVVEVVRSLYALKLFWLASRYNLERISQGQRPRDIAAGIHIGPINLIRGVHGQNPATRTGDREDACYHVGYAINLAKRVEGASRGGESSHIFATGEVYAVAEAARRKRARMLLENRADMELLDAIRFARPTPGPAHQFKGIDPPPDVCELDLSDQAKDVFSLLKSDGLQSSVRLMADAIAKPLRSANRARNPWVVPKEDQVTNKDMDNLYEHIRSHSSIWFQGDASILLTAWGHPKRKDALELVHSRLEDEAR